MPSERAEWDGVVIRDSDTGKAGIFCRPCFRGFNLGVIETSGPIYGPATGIKCSSCGKALPEFKPN